MKRVDRLREMDHMLVLMKEITILEERFEPHDTGHSRGAVRVLEVRVQEIRKELSLDE